MPETMPASRVAMIVEFGKELIVDCRKAGFTISPADAQRVAEIHFAEGKQAACKALNDIGIPMTTKAKIGTWYFIGKDNCVWIGS
jgi:hypothetical protein